MPRPIRWSDDDRFFGPFTYANENRGSRSERRILGAYLDSGDDDERAGCRLRMHLLGHTLIAALPRLFGPARQWVDTSHYEWSKNPNGGYWDVHHRSYGFLFVAGALHVDYGPQTHDSETDRTKIYFLPWRSWRHVRRSFYGLKGEHVATIKDRSRKGLTDAERRAIWDEKEQIEAAAPVASFAFDDFDGERITATTRIEEREWRLGEGKFRWLSIFRKPQIRRSLDIRFSAETGRRKGSWKGGTVGHSIEMKAGELHEAAFRRYCTEHSMTFIGPAA
ncbi:hypothetical protein FHS96_004954 [Sphingomonas zeicaulis]|uniref:hypothetical protein n=1 Tax=Sphingomonas zeicaulis TaxID=1632740 RepID=UPI003D25CA0A